MWPFKNRNIENPENIQEAEQELPLVLFNFELYTPENVVVKIHGPNVHAISRLLISLINGEMYLAGLEALKESLDKELFDELLGVLQEDINTIIARQKEYENQCLKPSQVFKRNRWNQ